MSEINWISVEDRLPEHGQRVLYYRPTKLTKIGEMVFYKNEKEKFKEINSQWANELNKPEDTS